MGYWRDALKLLEFLRKREAKPKRFQNMKKTPKEHVSGHFFHILTMPLKSITYKHFLAMLHCEKHLINQIHKNVEEINNLQQKSCRDEVEGNCETERLARGSSIPQPKPYQIPFFEVFPYPSIEPSTYL